MAVVGLAGMRLDRARQQPARHRIADRFEFPGHHPPCGDIMLLRCPHASRSRGMARIGLLGGSFNPAHRGHRHISLEAMRALGLDEVWWLVSPGNPLKEGAKDMAPFEARLASAGAWRAAPESGSAISSSARAPASRSIRCGASSGATPRTASSGCSEATPCQIFTYGAIGGAWPAKCRLR